MNPKILDKTKKRKIISHLADFGISKIPLLLIKTGQEKVMAYSGDLSNEEIKHLTNLIRVEGIGMYFGKEITEGKTNLKNFRLSLDAAHFLKNQIKEKIILLNEKQEEDWFYGHDLELTKEQQNQNQKTKGFVILQSYNEKDFIGVGRINSDKTMISNYLPKERRVKIGN